MPRLAEVPYQFGLAAHLQVRAGMDAHPVHPVGGHLPDSPELLYLQPFDEGLGLFARHHRQSVGFVVIRSYLGEKLIDRHAGRCSQTGGLPYPPANVRSDDGGRRHVVVIHRDIEVSLVERKGLHPVGIVEKDIHYPVRHFPIDVEPRRHEHESGTSRQCGPRRHGRTHPVPAGLVARSSHHPPFARMSHGNGHSPQPGIVPLLDGGIESIHIDMDYLTHRQDEMKRLYGRGGTAAIFRRYRGRTSGPVQS